MSTATARRQTEIPMEGPGVGQVKDKRLEQLGDELSELREKKSLLAEEITQVEAEALTRMQELEITTYRFRDREMSIKPGNPHVKVKEVKVGDASEGDDDES